MSQSELVECNDEMEDELNRVFDNLDEDGEEDMADEPKKKKSGRGRSKVAQNERLPHPPTMFRNKIHTAISNISHIVHQTGCNATLIIKDTDKNVYTYISPEWRSVYRSNPEAYATIVHMSTECEGEVADSKSTKEKASYSNRVAFKAGVVMGNTREGDGKGLVKRPMDVYMCQDMSTLKLTPPGGVEVDEDGDPIEPLDGMRKKLMVKRQEKDQEDQDQEKDLKKARELCSAFENANIVSTGRIKPAKPSFGL